uniref:Uncharacterized protein n=1 Tax=Zea mays TaxID=4577 RepID=C4J1C9_MAIZE|nr:unknown [Zea mays]
MAPLPPALVDASEARTWWLACLATAEEREGNCN